MNAVALVLSMLAATGPLEVKLRAVAALPGEPRIVSAAGVTRDETPILTIENPDAFDPEAARLRLVLLGDAREGGAEAVLAAVRWFKTRAPRALRQRWSLSALPAPGFEPDDTQSLQRWLTFQAADLIVAVGAADTIAALRTRMESTRQRSPQRDTVIARVKRDPLAIAQVLARRYPETPSISYIPALAWTQTLRLAAITNDESLREKVRHHTQAWIAGEKELFPPSPEASARQAGNRVSLTAVAGTMIFAELAASDGTSDPGSPTRQPRWGGEERAAAAALAEQGVALAAAEKTPAVPEHGQGWTDDMFMATAVLAPSGARPGHERDLDAAARLLIAYAARLQQANGLFNHAADSPAAWGRGNGFAALGLMETLTRLPSTHQARAQVLDIYRRQMAGALANQAPDGTWRQIVDAPGAYREETATAMLLSAMARGVRLGWLDRSYLPAIQRAWRALAAHVGADGSVIDVCTGTGAGPTRRYYYDRPSVTGADDRGGAMALLAALEMYELGTIPR